LVGERFIGEGTIHAHTQDLGVGGFQFFQVLLEVFHLLGSTTGESEDVERQNDVLLAMILGQSNVFQVTSVEVLQLEVRGGISDFQRRRCGSGLIGRKRHGYGEQE
jgi:hypothetical protein